MEQKSIITEYVKPIVFTILVLAVGTALLYQQGYFSVNQRLNPMIFGDMKVKIIFEGNTPEFVGYIPDDKLIQIPALAGDQIPQQDSMVLGYDEARDMAQENNITASQAIFGYAVDEEFLGGEIKVTGMLKKTGTILDMMHILPKRKYDSLPEGQRIDVKYTEDKMPKFFYYINPDGSNWPANLAFASGGLENFRPRRVDRQIIDLSAYGLNIHMNQNKTYQPLVLGSQEAKMMLDEKLITGVGDRLDGFFGGDAYVAGILNPTGTSLDMLHYMPAGS